MGAQVTRAKRDPASILDAILDRVPRMHNLRVAHIMFDGVAITLTPVDPSAEAYARMIDARHGKNTKIDESDEDPPPPEDVADPMNDRATYANGRVPGFTRPKKQTD